MCSHVLSNSRPHSVGELFLAVIIVSFSHCPPCTNTLAMIFLFPSDAQPSQLLYVSPVLRFQEGWALFNCLVALGERRRERHAGSKAALSACLLYTSDAADDLLCV